MTKTLVPFDNKIPLMISLTSGLTILRTRFTGKSSKSKRCLMSSAIPSTTCLTIIDSRIENSECLYKGVSDFKACLNYFCEDPARSSKFFSTACHFNTVAVWTEINSRQAQYCSLVLYFGIWNLITRLRTLYHGAKRQYLSRFFENVGLVYLLLYDWV